MKKLIQSLGLLLLFCAGHSIASERQNAIAAPVVARVVFATAMPAIVLRQKMRSNGSYRNIVKKTRQESLEKLETKMNKVLREINESPMSEIDRQQARFYAISTFSAVMTTCALI